MSIFPVFRWEGNFAYTNDPAMNQFEPGKYRVTGDTHGGDTPSPKQGLCSGGGRGGRGGIGTYVPGPLVEGSGGGGAGGYGHDGGYGCQRFPVDPTGFASWQAAGGHGACNTYGVDLSAECTLNQCIRSANDYSVSARPCEGTAYGYVRDYTDVNFPGFAESQEQLKIHRGGGGGGCGVGTDLSTGTSGGGGGGVGLYGTGDPSIAKFGLGGAGPVAGVSGGGGGQGAAGGADGATGAKACSAAGFGNPQYVAGAYGGGGAGSPGFNDGFYRDGLRHGHIVVTNNQIIHVKSSNDDGTQKTCAMPGGQGAVRIVWGGKSFPDNAH